MVSRENWPQTLNKPQLANFRPDRFAKNAGPQPWRTRRELRVGNSNAHLDLIRQLPCTLCERHGESDPHHLRFRAAAKERGVGMKATDRWSVPVCRRCHDEIHALGSRREEGLFRERGFNALALAHALWANTGALPRMNRVLLAHKLAAVREQLRR